MRSCWTKAATLSAWAAGWLVTALVGCSQQNERPQTEVRTIGLSDKGARELAEIDRLRRSGQLAEALSRCQALLNGLKDGDPDKLDAQLVMGLIRLDAGESEQAVSVLESLEPRLTEPPDRRARLLHELGNAYLARAGRREGRFAGGAAFRDDLESARKRQAEALELATRSADTKSDLVGRIRNSLGLLCLRQADYARAVEHLAAAEEVFRASNDTGSQIHASTNRIQAMLEAGQYAEAQKACDDLLKLPGAEADPRVLSTAGVAAMSAGRFVDASVHFSVARTIGADVGLKAEVTSNAAACAQEQGDFRMAEQMLTEALGMLDKPGVDPRSAAVIRANRGRMYLTLGRLDDAWRELSEVKRVQEELQGPQHPDALLSLLDLAAVAQEQAHLGEAQDLCERAMQGLTAALGEDHPAVAQARLLLASVLAARDRCSEAMDQVRRAVAVFDARLGRNHKVSVDAFLRALLTAAVCRESEAGGAAFAELYADAAPRIQNLRESLGPDHVAVLNAMVLLADISARTPAAYARALEVYQTAEVGFLKSFTDCHLSLAKLRAGEGRLLTAMGKPDEAVAICTRALGLACPGLEQHPARAALLEALGDAFSAQKADDRARRVYQEAYQILVGVYGREHPQAAAFAARHRP